MTPILGIWASQISGHLYDGPYGAYDALATVTVPSGGAASITFSGIPTGYKHLQIRGIGRSTYAGDVVNLYYRLNGDTTNANYTFHILRGNGGGSASAAAGTSVNLIGNDSIAGATAGANMFGAVVIDLLDYNDSTKNKTLRALNGSDRNGSGQISFDSSLWISTSPVTSVQIYPALGDFAQYSQFALYGVK